MDKRERAALFRARMAEAINEQNLSRSALASLAAIDRSALTQLMRPQSTALPNGHTLAGLAEALKVSADWLIGLSNEPAPATTILESAVTTVPAPLDPVDENILAYHREARGQKVRYVPYNLPTPFKTAAVLNHEYTEWQMKTSEQARREAHERMTVIRQPGNEVEIAMSMQAAEAFAKAEGLWQGLSTTARKEQLEALSTAMDELYPQVRLHLYDQRDLYSVPLNIFGHTRALIYVGQRYFMFPRGERVYVLIRHFDELVRGATVHPHQAADWFREMAARV